MKLFHTSPAEIKEITDKGRFGEFLFFSDAEYVMTAGGHVTYSIELAGSEVIEASQLFYHEEASQLEELVAELADQLGIEADDAESLIDESKNIYDLDLDIAPEDIADASWDIQLFTARAAKALGYRAVQVCDEQGAAWLVDMLGRESELELQ